MEYRLVLTEEQHRQIKSKAAIEGMSMKDLIIKAVAEYKK